MLINFKGSIYFRCEKVCVGGRSRIQFAEAIKLFALGCACDIIGYVHVPPRSIIVYAVSSVLNRVVLIEYSINCIARNVLTAAERGEQMGEVKANTLFGAKSFANIKMLEERIIVVVVFKVSYHPIVDRLHFFGIGITVCANFISKFFCLCIPQSCTTVKKIRNLRTADEIIRGKQHHYDKCRHCQNI